MAARVTKGGDFYLKALARTSAGAAQGFRPSRAPAGAAGQGAAPAATQPPRASRKLMLTLPDNRVEVTSDELPWSAVGLLEFEDAEGDTVTCSGALVGRRTVLTAGHVSERAAPTDPLRLRSSRSRPAGVKLLQAE